MVPFEFFGRLFQGLDGGRVPGAVQPEKIFFRDPVAVRERDRPFDDIFQFPHVPRKIVLREHFLRGRGQSFDASVQFGVEFFQEIRDEERNVFFPFPQRRHPDRDHVQPVVKVFPEFPLADRSFEIDVGGGNDPDVDLDRSGPADPLDRPLFQHPQ